MASVTSSVSWKGVELPYFSLDFTLMVDLFTGLNVRYVTVNLSQENSLGYLKLKSDTNQTGFLVFHYGTKANLRKSPTSKR